MFHGNTRDLILGICITGLLLNQATAQQSNPPDASSSLKVSRTPPAAYAKHIAPLLTPLKEVLARRGEFPHPDRDGIILLDESIVHCDESGARMVVYHMVEAAQTESAVEPLAEEVYGYRTEDQRIHLVQARTILPDGRELPVEDRAVILESAQTDAGDSLYGDRGQMRMIFSGVKPGVVRELIVVIEDDHARMPGEFGSQETWGAFWPVQTARFVVHVPDSVAARLRETRLGAGVPETQKKQLPGGWQAWSWVKERQEARVYEGARAPTDQTGPALFLTTLPDWETFGKWYRGLLEARSHLPEELAALAREWTKNAGSEQEKVEAVISRVARDIRYTGLEFGLGALQPRAPEQVWKTSYGDCKDKSNLAALLLRSLGIEARLTLIQTEHAGRVERRSPDTRHFNHAIVAVRKGNGWQFSDPTIRYGRAGMLAPSSADRDVLIMRENGIEWARTPPVEGGVVHYDLDAVCDPDGTVEGWLELQCEGYYLASQRAYYEEFNTLALKREVQGDLEALLPGARLIDVETGNGQALWRCFFSMTGQASGNETRMPLRFPAGDSVRLSMNPSETRETTRFLWPITWRVTGGIQLPAGWSVAENPAPFDLHTDIYQVRARWEVKDGVCRPDYEAKVTSALLTPQVHPAVWRGSKLLSAWLEKPLWLARGVAPVTAVPVAESLERFPLMPSGAGQLALVERRYPEGGDPETRRAALLKTIDFFPDDAETVFMARGRIASLEWDLNKHEASITAFRQILAQPSAKVDPATVAWARYMLALVLIDHKQTEEAVRELEKITAVEALSPFRRAWSLFQLARAREILGDLDGALRDSRAAAALHELDAAGLVLQQTAKLLGGLKRLPEFKKDLEMLVQSYGEESGRLLVPSVELADQWLKEGRAQEAEELSGMLASLSLPATHEAFTEKLKTVQTALANTSSLRGLQEELVAYLKSHPDVDALMPPKEGWPANAKESLETYGKVDRATNSNTAHRLALHHISAFPVDGEFGKLLWHAAAHLSAHEANQKIARPSALLLKLIELGRRLPVTDDNLYELRFFEGRMHGERLGDAKKAAAIFDELLADKDMPESFRTSCATRAADFHQQLGDWPRVLASLRKLEKLKGYASAGDGLARAAHLLLEQGDPQEAVRLMGVVQTSREFLLKHSDMPAILMEMLDIAAREKDGLNRWKSPPVWWKDWLALAASLSIEETPVEPLVTDPESEGAGLQEAVEARSPEQAGRILRRFAHNARWQPARGIDTAWMCVYRFPQLFPGKRTELLKFAASLLRPLRPMQEDQARARAMHLTVSLMDTDRAEEALDEVHLYFKDFPQDEHAVSGVMARLWGILAVQLKKELPEAAERLFTILKSDEQTDRGRSVSILADLLHELKRDREIRPLVERELDHPAIREDEDAVKKLKNLLSGAAAGSEVQEAVVRWLKKHTPPWFPHARPEKLDDEALEQLESPDELHPNDLIKLRLLAASQAARPADQLLLWWNQGLAGWLRAQALTLEQFDRAVLDVLEDKSAPAEMKDGTMRVAAVALHQMDLRSDHRRYHSRVPENIISSFSRDYYEMLDAVRDFDPKSEDSIRSVLETFRKKENKDLLVHLTPMMARRCLFEGDIAGLEKIIAVLGRLPKPAGSQAAAFQSLRLGLVKDLSGVKKLIPVHEGIARVVMDAHQQDLTSPMKDAPRIVGEFDSEMVGANVLRRWTAQRAKEGFYDRSSLDIWSSYVNACSEDDASGTWPVRRAVIQAAAAAARDDESRVQVCSLLADATDLDSMEERAVLFEAWKSWKDSAAMPRTYSLIRSIESRIAVRTGQPLDVAAVLQQMKTGGHEGRLRLMDLVQAMRARNKASVSAALDRMDADQMMHPGSLTTVIPALRLTGRDAEAELAVEAARDAVRESVLESWTGRDSGAAFHAWQLAWVLEDPALIPPEWESFLRTAYPDPHEALNHTMISAMLRKDWPAALKASEEANRAHPTFYSNYWIQARSLVELKREKEAVEPLRVYLRHCHDERFYHEATALLKKIAP
ncbi:MAG: DUF3857 domain-containing protein [Verrucomicrobiaceae bacterium]|nr:DUF3857 domain-containing protein [Verrucomicrobiaceae bacterium]